MRWNHSLTATLTVTACLLGFRATVGLAQKPAPGPTPVQVGVASWYGARWAGRQTTSGEIFHPEKLTAASPNLPLGSVIEVTNLRNGKTVRLLVNDRGPSHPGRILDVSRAAAKILGFVGRGITRVRIRLLHSPDQSPNQSEAWTHPSAGPP